MEESINERMAEPGFAGLVREHFSLAKLDSKQYSPLTLAYLGDAVYDLIVRTMIVECGNAPVNKLHKKTSSIVKAQAQAQALYAVEPHLTEEELAVYKRGRNAKAYTSAKNASMIDYRTATGFEALLGYLYLENRTERIFELLHYYFK